MGSTGTYGKIGVTWGYLKKQYFDSLTLILGVGFLRVRFNDVTIYIHVTTVTTVLRILHICILSGFFGWMFQMIDFIDVIPNNRCKAS